MGCNRANYTALRHVPSLGISHPSKMKNTSLNLSIFVFSGFSCELSSLIMAVCHSECDRLLEGEVG